MTKKQIIISIISIFITVLIIKIPSNSLSNPIIEPEEVNKLPYLLKPPKKIIPQEKNTVPEIEISVVSENKIQLEHKQITTAIDLLYSNDDEKRREGVELLGSYPNPESEEILTKLLISDANPEIRNLAALSLGSIIEPSDSTINDLIFVLGDESEDMSFSALSSLQNYMARAEKNSETLKNILEQLNTKMVSNEVTPTIRDAIAGILSKD